MNDDDIEDRFSKMVDAEVAKREKADAPAAIEGEANYLAGLSTAEYQLERKRVAKDLGIQVSALDKLVKAKRQKAKHDKSATAENDFMPHWKVEPWSDQVDGGALLNDLRHP
jgi:hypothetical protein